MGNFTIDTFGLISNGTFFTPTAVIATFGNDTISQLYNLTAHSVSNQTLQNYLPLPGSIIGRRKLLQVCPLNAIFPAFCRSILPSCSRFPGSIIFKFSHSP